jgi:hypothetical protein
MFDLSLRILLLFNTNREDAWMQAAIADVTDTAHALRFFI